jgi:DNA-binding transcriptional LysR family regulator
MIQLVSNGLGITILPSSIKNCNNPTLKFLPLDFIHVTSELALVFKAGTEENKVAQNFLKLGTKKSTKLFGDKE